MRKTTLSKFAMILCVLTISLNSKSQNCEVDKESIKGTYTGDCKKNKAHGKGKAVGTDSYEGDFKNGLPDGEGTYTWSNKNVFVGKFSKGLKEGKGMMTFKSSSGQDSVIDGYWKKDVYIGKHEKPWQIYSRTGSVRSVDVEYTPDDVSRVKVIISNTTGGVNTTSGLAPKLKVDNTVVLKGNFQRQTTLETHYKSTETSYFEISYPFRVKLQMGREEIDIEMFEQGSYTITISINN